MLRNGMQAVVTGSVFSAHPAGSRDAAALMPVYKTEMPPLTQAAFLLDGPFSAETQITKGNVRDFLYFMRGRHKGGRSSPSSGRTSHWCHRRQESEEVT